MPVDGGVAVAADEVGGGATLVEGTAGAGGAVGLDVFGLVPVVILAATVLYNVFEVEGTGARSDGPRWGCAIWGGGAPVRRVWGGDSVLSPPADLLVLGDRSLGERSRARPKPGGACIPKGGDVVVE